MKNKRTLKNDIRSLYKKLGIQPNEACIHNFSELVKEVTESRYYKKKEEYKYSFYSRSEFERF